MTIDGNPEGRRARADVVAAAIESAVAPMEMPGMLGDWMVIGSMINVDEDGDPDAQYFVLFSGGSMLQHHALGLLDKGHQMLTSGDASADGDDDA